VIGIERREVFREVAGGQGEDNDPIGGVDKVEGAGDLVKNRFGHFFNSVSREVVGRVGVMDFDAVEVWYFGFGVVLIFDPGVFATAMALVEGVEDSPSRVADGDEVGFLGWVWF